MIDYHATFWPNFELWPKSAADAWQSLKHRSKTYFFKEFTLSRPSSSGRNRAKCDRPLTDFGRVWAAFGRVGAHVARSRPKPKLGSTESGSSRQGITQFLCRVGPNAASTKFRPNSIQISMLDRFCWYLRTATTTRRSQWKVEQGGRTSGPEVRSGESPENLAGFGLTMLGFGRESLQPALFDAAEPVLAVLGGSGFRFSQNSSELHEADSGRKF